MRKKWSNSTLKSFYRDKYPLSTHLNALHKKAFYPFVESLNCESGFEFGCNIGKNLKNLGFENTSGIDISARAIKEAVVDGLICGDEKHLQSIEDDSYDVVFTCSVLNHIEDIDSIIEHLKRIAKKYVLLVESQDSTFQNHFPHNYEKMGFKKVFSEKTPKNIMYHGYYLEV